MKKFLLIFTLLSAFTVQSSTHNCFPENTKINPISYSKSSNQMTEHRFNEIIGKAYDVYGPIFKDQYGANLTITPDWKNSTVNAYAQQIGKTWKVHMYGGLARDPLVTDDGFLAVICHEIGHHVGGAPHKGTSWAANEGQSDYFATAKCLRKIFEKDLTNTLISYVNTQYITEEQRFAKEACQAVYKSHAERAICFRSALAGESLARLLGSLGGSSNVKFTAPDQKVVSRTDHNHPQGQCRLDSYFQGALCDADHKVWPSKTDASEGYCTSKDNYQVGLRPLCWFKPSEYGLER